MDLNARTWLRDFPFELQHVDFAHNVYNSRLGRAIWEIWLQGLPEQGTPPNEDTVRGGWHYERDANGRIALLTAVSNNPYRGVPFPPAPPLPWDDAPTTLCGIALNAKFWEDVILDRQYSRPVTCYDAVSTILDAWEAAESRKWLMTLYTFKGVPCVIV